MPYTVNRNPFRACKSLGHPSVWSETSSLVSWIGSLGGRFVLPSGGVDTQNQDLCLRSSNLDIHLSVHNALWNSEVFSSSSGISTPCGDHFGFHERQNHVEEPETTFDTVIPFCRRMDARRVRGPSDRTIFSRHWHNLQSESSIVGRRKFGAAAPAGRASLQLLASSPLQRPSLGIKTVERLMRRGFASEEQGHAKGPAAAYKEIVFSGQFRRDLLQDAVVASLQKLCDELLATENSSWLGSLMRKVPWVGGSSGSAMERPLAGQPRGIYLHGGVGVGKTMMMDLFYEHTPVKQKKRIHYHPFMLDVHERLHAKKGLKGSRDPVLEVAEEIIGEGKLLCLDEVEVTDIADALILLRLFSALWAKGVVLVATSNSPPQDLYKDGLNRHLFLPFIDLLQRHCQVFSLVSEAARDYRRGHAKLQELYVHPLGTDATSAMDTAFEALSAKGKAEPTVLPVMMGRELVVPLAADHVARFSFSALCRNANGAADYLALARRFKGLVIDGVPWMGHHLQENEARRFITLIDVLYEHHNVIACSAEVPLEDIFRKPDDKSPTSSAKDSVPSSEGAGGVQLHVLGEGGSSGRSTSMIGGMEWSGTGLPGTSLAGVANHASFTRKASSRTISRMLEMQSGLYLSRCGEMGLRAMSLVSPEDGPEDVKSDIAAV